MIGKFLGTIVRVVNSPLTAIDNLTNNLLKDGEDEKLLSAPLEELAKALDEVDKESK